MQIVSITENKDYEKRIAITPEIAKKYISLGFTLSLLKGYGSHIGFSDTEYEDSGVSFLNNEEELISKADIIIQLGLLEEKKLNLLKENTIILF